jgi:hypothetical protein
MFFGNSVRITKGNSEVLLNKVMIVFRFIVDILRISVVSSAIVLFGSDSVVVISEDSEFMVVGSTLVITEIILCYINFLPRSDIHSDPRFSTRILFLTIFCTL